MLERLDGRRCQTEQKRVDAAWDEDAKRVMTLYNYVYKKERQQWLAKRAT